MRNIILKLGISVLILFHFTNIAAIEVMDDLGRKVILERPAKRIISLAPHVTENLFAAGVGHLIVGAVSYSDYPEAAKSIQRVGGYNNLNIELVASLEPDLIIAWKEGNQKQQVEILEELGFIVYVNEPKLLEDTAKSIKNFGILTNMEEKAQQASSSFLNKLNSLREQYSGKTKISVFYQAWNNPLLTVNNQQSIGHIIKLCSGQNIFAELSALTPQVSIEAVLANDPEVIIASGMDESRPEWLDDWKQWTFLRAVKENHLFFVPPDIIQRHGPRILEGAQQVCESLQQVRRRTIR